MGWDADQLAGLRQLQDDQGNDIGLFLSWWDVASREPWTRDIEVMRVSAPLPTKFRMSRNTKYGLMRGADRVQRRASAQCIWYDYLNGEGYDPPRNVKAYEGAGVLREIPGFVL